MSELCETWESISIIIQPDCQVINNLDPQLPSNLVNNAIWATGEFLQQIKVETMDAKNTLLEFGIYSLIHSIS